MKSTPIIITVFPRLRACVGNRLGKDLWKLNIQKFASIASM